MTKTKLKTIFALLSGCMWVLSSCDQSDEKYPAASDELTMTCVQASWQIPVQLQTTKVKAAFP